MDIAESAISELECEARNCNDHQIRSQLYQTIAKRLERDGNTDGARHYHLLAKQSRDNARVNRLQSLVTSLLVRLNGTGLEREFVEIVRRLSHPSPGDIDVLAPLCTSVVTELKMCGHETDAGLLMQWAAESVEECNDLDIRDFVLN